MGGVDHRVGHASGTAMTQAVRCAVGPWSMNRFPTRATDWRMATAGSLASNERGAAIASEGTYIRVTHARDATPMKSAVGVCRNCCAPSQLP
jgi:hypothetical protein